jgi:hypothetical protein
MARVTMASGKRVLSKGTEFGKEKMEVPTLVNGSSQKLKVMEFTFGLQETNTRGNGRIQ